MADLRGTILRSILDRQKERRRTAQKTYEKQQDYKMKLSLEREKARLRTQEIPEEIPGYRKATITTGGRRFERIIPPEEQQIQTQEKAFQQGMTAASKESAAMASKLRRGEVLVNNISKLWSETEPPMEKGTTGYPTFGYGRGVQQFFGYQKGGVNQAIKSYTDFTGGMRGQLARTIGQDVGNLSEYEQRAILSLLPVVKGLKADFKETGEKKLQALKQVISDIYESRAQGFKDLENYYMSMREDTKPTLIPKAQTPTGMKRQVNKRTGAVRYVPVNQ